MGFEVVACIPGVMIPGWEEIVEEGQYTPIVSDLFLLPKTARVFSEAVLTAETIHRPMSTHHHSHYSNYSNPPSFVTGRYSRIALPHDSSSTLSGEEHPFATPSAPYQGHQHAATDPRFRPTWNTILVTCFLGSIQLPGDVFRMPVPRK